MPRNTHDFAYVRGEVSYTITQAGSAIPIHQGLFVSLTQVGDQWRVLQFNPDDLLNLEYYMSDTAASASLRSSAKSSPRELPPGLSNLHELNHELNDMFLHAHLSKQEFLVSVGTNLSGYVPVIGHKGQAVIETAIVAKNVYEGAKDIWENGGWTTFATVKVQEVALGGIQIVWHGTVGFDANAFAALDAAVAQEAETVKIHSAIHALQASIAALWFGGSPVRVSPRLFLLEDDEWDYPDGFTAVTDPTVTDYSYGPPLLAINLTDPGVLDHHFPFRVVGELMLPSALGEPELADELGAVKRGDHYYVPLDVTELVDSNASTGDIILDGFQFGMARLVPLNLADWHATCRRGKQQLSVHLKNGETTLPITIVNSYMNFVTGLEIHPAPGNPLSLNVNDSRSGLRVFGSGPSQSPELTNRPECLDMRIEDPSVASLSRSSPISIRGVAEGSTVWDLLLGGSSDPQAHATDVNASVNIVVKSSQPTPPPPGKNYFNPKYLEVDLGMTCADSTGSQLDCSLSFDDTNPGSTLTFTGNHFSMNGQYQSQNGSQGLTRTFSVEGDLNADRSMVTNVTISCTQTTTQTSTTGSFTSTEVAKATLNNLKATWAWYEVANGAFAPVQFLWYKGSTGQSSGQITITVDDSNGRHFVNMVPYPTGDDIANIHILTFFNH